MARCPLAGIELGEEDMKIKLRHQKTFYQPGWPASPWARGLVSLLQQVGVHQGGLLGSCKAGGATATMRRGRAHKEEEKESLRGWLPLPWRRRVYIEG